MSERAIFLNRDNTLIEDPGYINHPDQVKLLDGVAEALIELKGLGYKLIVATNQSAVARGIITEKVLGEIHDRLEELLAEQNVSLDRIYYCPYHPDGVVPKYSKESNCRKPAPGMFQKAAAEMNLDLSQSWSIGGSSRDVEAGRRAGCKTVLIDTPSRQKPSGSSPLPEGLVPDYKAINAKEAVNIIKQYLRSSGTDQGQTESVSADPNASASEIAGPIPQTEERQLQSQVEEPLAPADRTDDLLNDILGQLKSMQRDDMFSEFSVMRLMAGVVQVVVLFCLLITVWFLMSPARQDNSVFIALGFAVVFQLMALTFYLMQGRK